MLTYHDSSGSFSHRNICNCNEVRSKRTTKGHYQGQGQNLSAKIEPKSTESYITNLESTLNCVNFPFEDPLVTTSCNY